MAVARHIVLHKSVCGAPCVPHSAAHPGLLSAVFQVLEHPLHIQLLLSFRLHLGLVVCFCVLEDLLQRPVVPRLALLPLFQSVVLKLAFPRRVLLFLAHHLFVEALQPLIPLPDHSPIEST